MLLPEDVRNLSQSIAIQNLIPVLVSLIEAFSKMKHCCAHHAVEFSDGELEGNIFLLRQYGASKFQVLNVGIICIAYCYVLLFKCSVDIKNEACLIGGGGVVG